MAVLIVIPARYASTRYPGKPLAELKGATGEARSLIRRSWEAACAVPGVDRVRFRVEGQTQAATAGDGQSVSTPVGRSAYVGMSPRP